MAIRVHLVQAWVLLYRILLKLPLRYRDELPELPPPAIQDQQTSIPKHVIIHVFNSIHTCFNKFGIAREYRHHPTYDLDAAVSGDDLSNIHPPQSNIDDSSTQDIETASSSNLFTMQPPWPWKSMLVWCLMSWLVTGSNWKSMTETKHLVNEVLRAEDFDLKDFENFNPDAQMKHFDASEDCMDVPGIFQQDGWKETDVKIMVLSKEKNPKGNGHMFSVSGLLYQPLVAVIKAAFSFFLRGHIVLVATTTGWPHLDSTIAPDLNQCRYSDLTSIAFFQAEDCYLSRKKCIYTYPLLD
ncbi:uncharacterized protein BJ212DRAFT_1299051 [Suillus subaureus]|uniref:Uncharacterized protein n=1 Tax=Suillus subaureus TaxID=48587 RepID=A0A9P7JDW7_9AGAM|nr:uncharacterized protein BJ212DRAFT_1299051 [Suillus subaureus]KAG1817489.1 hypothetical protein BJ212DRAFT_1299051 [Suillus subaureus]